VYFLISYWFPAHWFPGWHPQGKVLELAQTDTAAFVSFLIKPVSAGLKEHIIFTYLLIYFLLPRFLIKEKYLSFLTGIVLILTVFIIYKYNAVLKATWLQQFGYVMNDKKFLFSCAWENVLFNLPTVGGIALGIKLMKYWWLRQRESLQLTNAKANAELQLLKAQVHPHFLFNTLNNIYSFILTSSHKAPQLIKKLSGLLHYIIHECGQPQVLVEKELNMIRDYVSLETIRYGDQFDITVDIRGNCSGKLIAPLLLLPFVENSFKHGTSKMLSKPWVNLNIIIEDRKMFFMLNNSRPVEYCNSHQNGGIGLANVQKRLQLLYPKKHELKITSEPEHFTVLLQIDLLAVNEKSMIKNHKKQMQQYEMA